MTAYYVEWRIDVEADSPEEAARKALKIQHNPESWAIVFHVYRPAELGVLGACETIDLSELDDEPKP